MKIPILYEDNHLLVINKPPNLLSQPDRTGDADVLTLLKNDLKIRYKKPGNVYLGLVHRLDRPVGGVMVFAKTSKAAARLSKQIRNRKFRKVYLAVVRGRPKKSARLRHYLSKDYATNMVSIVAQASKDAKEAILDYTRLAAGKRLSLLKISLITGRPHQIRVQLNALGHPLYGDLRYDPHSNSPGQQIALFSHEISCNHPTLKKVVTFKDFPASVYPWDQFPILFGGC